LSPDAETTSFTDAAAVPRDTNDPLYFYQVKGLSACYFEPGP